MFLFHWQALRNDSYDHYTAIYYLLLEKLKQQQRLGHMTGDQVMFMVCSA